MFTGLVSDVGTVVAADTQGALKRLRIACAYPAAGIALGASIACSGPCLTVVAVDDDGGRTIFDVDVGAETLERTTAGSWAPGTRLNLERSLKVGDELGGHIVTGHVDGVATILETRAFDGMTRFDMEVPARLARFVAEKGSVGRRRHVAHRQQRDGRASLRASYSPHARGHDLGRAPRRRPPQPRDRPDGALRRSAHGDAGMTDLAHWRMMAGYNTWANIRVYEAASRLADADYRADRGAFFRSVHGTLNHLLTVDRIFMKRITGQGDAPDRLDAVLFDAFAPLQTARIAEDARIADFVDALSPADLAGTFTFSLLTGSGRFEQHLSPALTHIFNHQTHHRGQVHTLLTGLVGAAPVLDLLAFQRETGIGMRQVA